MPRPTPIVIPGPTGMGGNFTQKQTNVDLGPIISLIEYFKNQKAQEEGTKALGQFMGLNETKVNYAPEESGGYLVDIPQSAQPGLDLNAIAKSPIGQSAILDAFKAKFGPVTWDKLMTQKYLAGDQAGVEDMIGKKQRQYTGTIKVKDQETGQDVIRKYNPKTGNYDILQGEAPATMASTKAVSPEGIADMGHQLANGKMSYDLVQRNLLGNPKAQTDFVSFMKENYPKFNYVENIANTKYYVSTNTQDRLRFIDSLLGDPQTGETGQIDYVKQLSNAVDRTQYPQINKAILKFNKDYAGDDETAQFMAGLYNVAVESARAAASSGAVVPQERVDQELDRMSAAYNKGQLSKVLDTVAQELRMRRTSIVKGTPGARPKENKPTSAPASGGDATNKLKALAAQGNKKAQDYLSKQGISWQQ